MFKKIAPRLEVLLLYVWEFNVFPSDELEIIFIKQQTGEGIVVDERHFGKAVGCIGLQVTPALDTLAAEFLKASFGDGLSFIVGDDIWVFVPSKQKEGVLGGRI